MSNKLYHSDVYRGQDFSIGLKHYKYLRKVKTSYGWRYVYDESEVKNEEKKIGALQNVRNKMTDKDGYLNYTNKQGDSVYKKGNKTHIITANGKQTKTDKFKEGLDAKINEKIKKHKKQKIKDIPKKAISKGIAFVSNLKYKIYKNWVK